ncbi:HoxN/HupN/NixA family nickel/cobalt transporter [Streptomyces acidiscabies]|uniref:HoxN/HupN/NixA family nickel/cobalt transporter n=1 Tax=Streptomyces acidiscabies TaxID=42234 RepID=UPI00095DCA37|nr:sulfite exporter TauE/SafE family protein [Streptomyces acidiscabies]GAV44704.1 nickel/cobalt efflux system RcnA [Streptomyces acidiscabies]
MISRRLFASSAAVLTAGCALALLPTANASAHPLGNFTVNRYDGLVAAPGQLRVTHVEDLAEIPATQAKPTIERLGGLTPWAQQRCETAAADSKVTVNGTAVTLTSASAKATVRPGQAGLNTLRVECELNAPLPKGESVSLTFHSAGASTGPGWREITARGDRMTLTKSDVPEKSVSDELTSYPQELLSSPADTTTAATTVEPGGPALTENERTAPGAAILPRGADRWTQALDDLVARQHLTFGFAALAIVLAIFLGAMHAVAPGHGKTIMAATAAARGGKARMKDVLPLAASVTVTHTIGVVALGLLVTAGSAAAPSVITWLGLASGALVAVAGVTLFRKAWKNRRHGHGHSHGHDHGHGHSHSHDDDHGHDHGHSHGHGHPHSPKPSPSRQLALVGAESTSATTTALPNSPSPSPTPSHDHSHTHEHDTHHDDDHKHDHHTHEDHTHTHTHNGHTHTHSIAPTLRGTILLGLAGGMVPSPSAVVVLVGAAALGQAWFGLLLVIAYGIGLALTLTAAGFAVVRLGSRVSRLLDEGPRWTSRPVIALVRRNMPLWSALIVVALGVGLMLKGAATVVG